MITPSEFCLLRGDANRWRERIKADGSIEPEDKKILMRSLLLLREYAAKRMDEARQTETKP